MLRIGLLGAGRAGQAHARAYRQVAGADLAWVADARPEAARALAAELHLQSADSPAELLARPDVDVVDICVPTPLHRRYVELAAAAGKHVICEKPIALTVADGRAMIEACRRAGVRLFIGHVARFLPEYQRLKALLDAGSLGTPLAAKTWRGGRFFAGSDGWIKDAGQSGSILVEATLHDFDILRWCFGEVDRVQAVRRTAHDPVYVEYAQATLRFRSGLVATVEGNWVFQERFYYTCEVYGTRGVAAFDSRSQMPLRLSKAEVEPAGVRISERFENPLEFDQFVAELGHFLGCLETGRPPLVTPEDACRALEIALAACRSHQSGQVVSLADS